MPKILAIDDIPDNLVSIKALLKMMIESCEVLTAESGRQGIEAARSRQPDVILLDIHMPEMDGFQVCEVLKSDPRTATIPIVILTAMKTASRHRIKALELGADAFLTKPVNEAELAAQVKAMLRIKAAEDRLRNENVRLEELVNQRIRELMAANEQLDLEKGQRESIQKTLSQSETRFKTMIEKCPLPMVVIDEHQNALFLNEKFMAVFGYGLEEISTAEDWWQAAAPDPEYRSKVRGCWDLMLKNGGPPPPEQDAPPWQLTSKDGQTRFCEFNIVPLEDVSLIIINDITDRITVEVQRAQLEKQLQQAQKMEAVGALAGGIAHDFNNILSPLMGFAELLKEDLPGESPMTDSVDEILKAAFRARDLVQQILSFSRQMDKEVSPIRIQSVIKEVIRLSKSIIPTTISIEHRIDNACPPVLADPTQIHQLVMNLVTNAYHAMERAGGILTVTLKETELSHAQSNGLDLVPGTYICLSVKDTGTGMDKRTMDRIFDPYFTTKGITKGTGLGLSVVHGIVKNSSGDITVSSKKGEGSEFKVFFPAIQEALHPANRTEAAPLPKGRGRILLVDDEPHIVKIEKQMLERLGYQVVAMENPLETLALFSARPTHFDLVITDMTMPGITGDVLAVKLMEIRPDLPVIICTGFSDQINQESAVKIGVSALLMKPVLTSDMALAVKSALAERDLVG